jgi:alpha-beta hydrolase superfamily lysophospholipase
MKIILVCALALLLASCSLDDFLYNAQKIDRYDLSTAIIPEADRTEVTFNSGGNTLYGFDVRPPDSTANGFVVLYCHGNKNHIGEYWDRVELFYEMGVRCFIFDYRGFGRSSGQPSISGLAEDGRAALRFVLDSLHIDTTRLFFYGYSLGNVVSIDLAANVLTPYRLVAEAPFASTDALLQSSTPLDIPGSFVVDESVNNAERIRAIHTPFLLLHGDHDDFLSWNDNGRVVYENAPQPKQLELVPGANHTDIPDIMGHDIYRARIMVFLNATFDSTQSR